MRLPRLRFTVRGVMVGVVVTATLLVLAKKMTRPYPTWSTNYGGVLRVMWSDGSITLDHTVGTPSLRWHDHGLVTVVVWPDGARSAHLHLSDWAAARFYPSPKRDRVGL